MSEFMEEQPEGPEQPERREWTMADFDKTFFVLLEEEFEEWCRSFRGLRWVDGDAGCHTLVYNYASVTQIIETDNYFVLKCTDGRKLNLKKTGNSHVRLPVPRDVVSLLDLPPTL